MSSICAKVLRSLIGLTTISQCIANEFYILGSLSDDDNIRTDKQRRTCDDRDILSRTMIVRFWKTFNESKLSIFLDELMLTLVGRLEASFLAIVEADTKFNFGYGAAPETDISCQWSRCTGGMDSCTTGC